MVLCPFLTLFLGKISQGHAQGLGLRAVQRQFGPGLLPVVVLHVLKRQVCGVLRVLAHEAVQAGLVVLVEVSDPFGRPALGYRLVPLLAPALLDLLDLRALAFYRAAVLARPVLHDLQEGVVLVQHPRGWAAPVDDQYAGAHEFAQIVGQRLDGSSQTGVFAGHPPSFGGLVFDGLLLAADGVPEDPVVGVPVGGLVQGVLVLVAVVAVPALHRAEPLDVPLALGRQERFAAPQATAHMKTLHLACFVHRLPTQFFDLTLVLAAESYQICASCAEFGFISTIAPDFRHFNARGPSLELGHFMTCLDVIAVCAGWCGSELGVALRCGC